MSYMQAKLFFQSAKVQSLLSSNCFRKPFPRIHYDEAVTVLQSKGEMTSGGRLNKENELTMVRHCGGPLFVLRYPHIQKPFYMKRCGNYVSIFNQIKDTSFLIGRRVNFSTNR